MEKKLYSFGRQLLWIFSLSHFIMVSRATNLTSTESSQLLESNGYAWSAWSAWSACSRPCGGGVSVQQRQCLPRLRNVPVATTPTNVSNTPPVITVRVTRQTHEDCEGVDKRYHECNNIPCPGGETYSRADQCASYDRRPFRGRFYTWVPYIDGNSPCTLNCRPLGQQFYASLALVADGTSCTKLGFRAICVQGTCKAIGRESVLASAASRELRCGHRLVSGLFSRMRLPLGYTYVTTVPRGACRLNVSELVPTGNYLALKISNSSYIMNGEFAVSAPGTYEAAGARFIYTRNNELDSILAYGPIHSPIDIMILYTEPTPSIKYEYFIEASADKEEIDSDSARDMDTPNTKHTRRHHNYDAFLRTHARNNGNKEINNDEEYKADFYRHFFWKIVSYTHCTRSCGGGVQLGKYHCVEQATGKEVSAVHCSGSTPPTRRRRCGMQACPPRWRAASWSTCPPCGPAFRNRSVGCVQDNSRGITKIRDTKCPAPKPKSTEKCDIPDCNAISGSVRISSANERDREETDTFKAEPVFAVSNRTGILGPEYSFTATAGWLYTDWSECVGWCVGGGIQSRSLRCSDPSGCTPRKIPEHSRSCSPNVKCEPIKGQWFMGVWSNCSSKCGGKQIRGVLCIGGTGRHLKDSACTSPKPAQEQDCGTECGTEPTWYFGDWGECNGDCSSNTSGIQRRSVVCGRGDDAPATDECGEAPPATRSCEFQCTANVTKPPVNIEPHDVTTTTQGTQDDDPTDCQDKLTNCQLAVQARLCHYKYYIQNCCKSCEGR